MENSPLEDGCIGNQVASELDPYKPPFINVVSNEDEKHESKGLKIVLSKTVAWGTKPLVSVYLSYCYRLDYQFYNLFFDAIKVAYSCKYCSGGVEA